VKAIENRLRKPEAEELERVMNANEVLNFKYCGPYV
jgi:hypothetical protein